MLNILLYVHFENEFGVSRETWYKWKRRYDAYGIDGLKDQSRKPHNIKNLKVTEEIEKLILELRLNNRFGPMRIRFRLKRKYEVGWIRHKNHLQYSKDSQAQCTVCQTKKKIQTL